MAEFFNSSGGPQFPGVGGAPQPSVLTDPQRDQNLGFALKGIMERDQANVELDARMKLGQAQMNQEGAMANADRAQRASQFEKSLKTQVAESKLNRDMEYEKWKVEDQRARESHELDMQQTQQMMMTEQEGNELMLAAQADDIATTKALQDTMNAEQEAFELQYQAILNDADVDAKTLKALELERNSLKQNLGIGLAWRQAYQQNGAGLSKDAVKNMAEYFESQQAYEMKQRARIIDNFLGAQATERSEAESAMSLGEHPITGLINRAGSYTGLDKSAGRMPYFMNGEGQIDTDKLSEALTSGLELGDDVQGSGRAAVRAWVKSLLAFGVMSATNDQELLNKSRAEIGQAFMPIKQLMAGGQIAESDIEAILGSMESFGSAFSKGAGNLSVNEQTGELEGSKEGFSGESRAALNLGKTLKLAYSGGRGYSDLDPTNPAGKPKVWEAAHKTWNTNEVMAKVDRLNALLGNPEDLASLPGTEDALESMIGTRKGVSSTDPLERKLLSVIRDAKKYHAESARASEIEGKLRDVEAKTQKVTLDREEKMQRSKNLADRVKTRTDTAKATAMKTTAREAALKKIKDKKEKK